MKSWKRCEVKENHLSMTKSNLPRNLLNLKSVTNFKGFEALQNIILDNDNQQLCFDVQMEAE